jgi:signal transduction histidine kinase
MSGSRPKSWWRAVALVAAVVITGAIGSLAMGLAVGMDGGELGHMALLLVPAALVTLVATAAAGPLLRRATWRYRLMAVALVAVVACLANLAMLAALMLVDPHDAATVSVLLLYSTGAGIGAALMVDRSSVRAVNQLERTARALGSGDLSARAGPVEGGLELEVLGRTLDNMADRLEAAIQLERAAELSRRDLMTAVSHDLRSPLASLRAMVEAIDDGMVQDLPSLRRYAGEMRRSVDALVQLVDDLFELAKVDAGAIQAEAGRARLEDVVRSAVQTCQSEAREKRLDLRTNLDGAGQTACSPRLVRVLQNLLQNAIRHTPADGRVWIEAHPEPAGLRVAVEDSGEGIAPDALGRVFEPFWRGETARSSPGSGLGLALTKRIVEALGGSITVTSQPAAGARFEMVLPYPGS